MAILYRHIRPDKNEVFYIGIGETENRADSIYSRNKHWHNIVDFNNGVYEIEILFEDISWETACEKEIWWIAFYGRADLGKGTLCNLTDGGEGAPNRICKEETKEKIRAANLGERNHNYNVSMSQEQKDKISNSQKGKKNHNFGKIASKETREKMSKSQTGKKRTSGQAISKALQGHICSEETKNKLRQKRLGKLPSTALKVINVETNKIYNSIKEASQDYEKSEKSLANRLNGKVFNETQFKFI